MRSETPFLGVSRPQDLATRPTSSTARDHRNECTVLALDIRFDAEWLLKHFMNAQAINCPPNRGNSRLRTLGSLIEPIETETEHVASYLAELLGKTFKTGDGLRMRSVNNMQLSSPTDCQRETMLKWLKIIVGTLRSSVRSHRELTLENLALRQQLATLKHRCPKTFIDTNIHSAATERSPPAPNKRANVTIKWIKRMAGSRTIRIVSTTSPLAGSGFRGDLHYELRIRHPLADGVISSAPRMAD